MAGIGEGLEQLSNRGTRSINAKGKRKAPTSTDKNGKPQRPDRRNNKHKGKSTTPETPEDTPETPEDTPETPKDTPETPKENGNEHNTKRIRFTYADAAKDNELTSTIFSELREDEDFENKNKPTRTFTNEEDIDYEAEEEEETAKPAWVDEDDEILVNTKRTLHLPEKVISGHEYQEKLRHKHKMQSIQSDEWAQVKKKKKSEDGEDDSDGEDEILYRSQPLTVPDTRLMSGIIKIVFKPIKHKHQSAVRRVTIHPVQPIAMSVDGNTVKVYHLGDKVDVMHTVRMQDMHILDACFSHDGSQIFVCGDQPSLYVLEVGSGKVSFLRNVLGKKEKRFPKIYAAPDGKSCALLGGSGSIIILSTLSKVMTKELRGPSNSIYSATYTPEGRLIASYAGGTVLVWDVERQIPVHSFTNPSLHFATAMAISPNGEYLALGSNVGVVDVFLMKEAMATSNPKQHATLENLTTSICSLKFNHDSQILAITSDLVKAGLRLIHIPSFEVYKNWPNVTEAFSLVKDISFSPAGGFLMTGENTGRLKLYRLPHYPAA